MIIVMMCTGVSSYAKSFVVRCMGLDPVEFGMGWGWLGSDR